MQKIRGAKKTNAVSWLPLNSRSGSGAQNYRNLYLPEGDSEGF